MIAPNRDWAEESGSDLPRRLNCWRGHSRTMKKSSISLHLTLGGRRRPSPACVGGDSRCGLARRLNCWRGHSRATKKSSISLHVTLGGGCRPSPACVGGFLIGLASTVARLVGPRLNTHNHRLLSTSIGQGGDGWGARLSMRARGSSPPLVCERRCGLRRR